VEAALASGDAPVTDVAVDVPAADAVVGGGAVEVDEAS